jgi:hypothetical protein
MSDVYLSEEAEDLLRRKALDNVFLAVITKFVATSANPTATLSDIKAIADGLSQAGTHSDNDETNEYARNLVASTVELYLNQIRIGGQV